MGERRYQTNQSLVRRDGQMAFSPRSRGIYDRRATAEKGGRIQKVLGTDGTFSDQFKAACHPDTEHLWILERVHLEKELKASKKIRKALAKYHDDHEAATLLAELNATPTFRKKDCVLCPIWRHERELAMINAAASRYVFRRARDQLYLLTVVFAFADNLDRLEEALHAAHAKLRTAVAHMGRKRCGVMMVGSFEPDLKTHEALTTEKKSIGLLRQLNITPTDAGGWTLTGHFLVRVPHRKVLEEWLRKTYPAKGWTRVQFKRVSTDRTLTDHLCRILGYAAKMPSPLFDPPTRSTQDGALRKANEQMQRMSAAFHGATMDDSAIQGAMDLDAAITQWAKFVSRMGPKLMYYSVESAHAQKWLSESEMAYLRESDEDMFSDGRHKIEIHRDHGFFPPYEFKPHLRGRMRDLRSRPLAYDPEWEKMTDCSGIDPATHRPDFERWILKP